MTEEELAKLPKWAQRKYRGQATIIESLKGRLDVLEGRTHKGGDTFVDNWGQRQESVGLDRGARIRFIVQNDEITAYVVSGELHILGRMGNDLHVVPRSGNYLLIVGGEERLKG